MFDFIAFAYVIQIPILIGLVYFLENDGRKKAVNYFALVNLSIIVYSGYVLKQVIGLYLLARQLGIPPMIQNAPANYMLKLGLEILLPFLFLKRSWMINRFIAFVVWLVSLFLKTYMISGVDRQPVWLLFVFYGGLLYALYWLLKFAKRLPFQSLT